MSGIGEMDKYTQRNKPYATQKKKTKKTLK